MSNSNCWIQVWDKEYYDNSKDDGRNPNEEAKHYHKYYGPIEEDNLEDVHWPGNPHNNENNEYSSIITGPEAKVTFYFDEGCGGDESISFGPNTKIPKLKEYPRGNDNGDNWSNCITSFKVERI